MSYLTRYIFENQSHNEDNFIDFLLMNPEYLSIRDMGDYLFVIDEKIVEYDFYKNQKLYRLKFGKHKDTTYKHICIFEPRYANYLIDNDKIKFVELKNFMTLMMKRRTLFRLYENRIKNL